MKYCKKCGHYSGNYDYCYSCYYKFKKNKSINIFEKKTNKLDNDFDDDFDNNLDNNYDDDFDDEFDDDFDDDFDDEFDDEFDDDYNDDFFDKEQLKKYNIRVSNPKYAQASFQKNRIYLCKNGNRVRSKSERTISNFLTDHKVPHAYEKPLKYNDGTIKYLYPDFYIPSIVTYTGRVIKDIYIEHLGGPKSKNSEAKEKYMNSTKYKMAIYKHLKLTVLCTTEDDMINPEETLKHKLINIKEHKINY